MEKSLIVEMSLCFESKVHDEKRLTMSIVRTLSMMSMMMLLPMMYMMIKLPMMYY